MKGSIWLIALLSLCFTSACNSYHHEDIDKLNSISYAYHYRNLDSTVFYADKAYKLSTNYNAGQAEALNNKAFVSIARMDYSKASRQLDSVGIITDNQLELLIADIQHMRLCQRESQNKDFYNYRERASLRLKRINEEKNILSTYQQKRLLYACSEYGIVNSTYYYYVGQEQNSINALKSVENMDDLQKDTAQFLNYLYNVGAGGIITNGTQVEINQKEFNYLVLCYFLSKQYNYPFWIANSMQAISEHLQIPAYRNKLIHDNLSAVRYVNEDNMPDSLLAGYLAQRSLDLFGKYGDVYQTAGSYRTLSQCYWQINDYRSSLICLQNALFTDTIINQTPDLVASIREQMSVVYSAMDDKTHSDYNRNIYLDLQEKTRQDRYLESRADQLDKSSAQLNMMIIAVIVMIIAVVLLLFVFNSLRHHRNKDFSIANLLKPLEKWQQDNERNIEDQNGKYESINEDILINDMHIAKNKRRNMEQRAKISLANSIMPYLDRIINEIERLKKNIDLADIRKERYDYIIELIDRINVCNETLTQWIQLRQGELSLKIESFTIQPLFDIVSHSSMEFQLKGIKLVVMPSSSCVKADKTLTLFMLNTLADNARKFTQSGGTVTISSEEHDDYVEISVSDTGMGIDEEQLDKLFSRSIKITDSNSLHVIGENTSHGFGLLNCKGIIDKYRKISKIFSVCNISAKSEKGKGSRFSFRLPKGVTRTLLLVLPILLFSPLSASSVKQHSHHNVLLRQADSYADSAYFSNIYGHYSRTLDFADSVRNCLNTFYKQICPKGKDYMERIGNQSAEPAEIKWYHDSLPFNYNTIIDIRNESAVAELALHDWESYRYNNKVYTQLFKECSADNTLDSYCRVMQKSETNKNVAIIILILLLLMIFPAYYLLYYRHLVYFRLCVDKVSQINAILLNNSSMDKKMEEIKSLSTDKFPPILQDIVGRIITSLDEGIKADNSQNYNIEIAQDSLRKSKYENDKLHISNSVLDNCLSTLKHETMYYPSRIRQLVDGTDYNLHNISELASYYKELSSILLSQSMRQFDHIKIDCRPIPIADILETDSNLKILGDKDMLVYLFELIKKISGEEKLHVEISEKGHQYVKIEVILSKKNLSHEQCMNLFTPSTENIPYLLCRQIVRENGERANAHACGIIAEPLDEGGICLEVTLSRAKNLAEKE